LKRGQFLDEYLGRISDVRVIQGAFAKVQSALLAPHEEANVVAARAELAEMFPSEEGGSFLSKPRPLKFSVSG